MTWIPPVIVAVPLLTAAVVAGGDHVMPSRLKDALGMAGMAAVCGLGVLLMLTSERHDVVHWFGGWHPRGGVAIGVDFAVDPFAAATTALAGGVGLLTLAYARSYLEDAARLFDALFLLMCAAVCGFVMSGDLFNIFVWLELMGVAAYALTGFEVKELGPLQGAVNFSIVNTIGGFFVVIAIALLYARTGALNLAQIGHTLAGRHADGLVVVALTLVVCGFLCKSAVAPFHLWLADAYAVAPAPVCAFFAAVMTDIGLFGVARVYWTVFDAPFGSHEQSVGQALVWLGIVTALVGGLMAFLQRHLKRMLAYAVVCHIGVMLAGIGLLASKGLAGSADMLLAHGLVTAGLFLVVGVLIVVCREGDELALHGRGRGRPWLAALWILGAVALAGPPYVGVYLGHALIDEAASDGGRHWVQPLLWLADATASAALLRAGARVFLGLGPARDPLLSPEMSEKPPRRGGRVAPLGAIAGLFVVAGAAVSIVPGLGQRTVAAADRFRDRAGYANLVLHGVAMRRTPPLPFAIEHTTLESLLYGSGSLVLAVAFAALGLYRQRLRVRAVGRLLRPPVVALKAVHSGVIGDYVMWLVVGTAVLGGVWAVTLR
jgi:multicomponent Na+:H+ antiporter subunit D